jgi:lysozyme
MTLRELLIKHEGKKRRAYLDTEGNWTVGVGRNLEGVDFSEDEIQLMLNNDMKRVLYACWHEFPWFADLNEDRQNVVANMVFNLGLEGFKKFKKMIAAIQKEDYVEAACQMVDSKWATQVKGRAVELAVMMKGCE